MKPEVEPTRNPFLDNPCYVQYVELLLQLHTLMAQGKSESEAADAVRDAMDKPWYGLSEAERRLVSIMSADLYMIEGDEVFRPVPAEERTQVWLQPRIDVARQIGDWESVLAFLRNGPDYMTPDHLAALRGSAYNHLEHPEVSTLFFNYAAELKPDNIVYTVFALAASSRFDMNRAVTQANELLGDQRTHPYLLVVAADIAYNNVPRGAPEERKTMTQIVRSLERAIKVKPFSKNPMLYNAFMEGLSLLLSGSYLRLGREREAIKSLNIVLSQQPANSELLRLRDVLMFREAQQNQGDTSNDAVLSSLEQSKHQWFNEIAGLAPAA